jgi:ankyrin repeat protein
MSQVSSELKYAVNHWANHVILSKDTAQDLMDLILKTFSTSLPTLEKWWTMFMTWNYGLSHHHDLRKHNTTPLHVFAMLGLSEILKTCDQDWIYDFTASQDAQGLDPLGLAILHDQFGMAEILGANQNFTQVFHCALATVSSVRVADMIFCKLDPRVHDLGMEAMKAMTWHACLTGEPALLESTTNFLFIKSSAGTFPWDIVTYANDTICSGDHRLLPKVLEMTSMKENAQQIIENAVAQHEPRMLEVILNYDVVQKMVQHGQIPLIDALNSALIRKCVPMSKLLLTKQTMNVQDGPGRRPLEYAVKYPNIHTLMLFLAQPEFAFDKGTIEEGVALNLMLHKAGVDVNIENLGKMLKRGARMRYEHFGMTALHVAAERGRTEVMKMLLETLADSEIKNDIDRTCGNCHKDQGRDGMTALAIASLKGYDEIVELLMNKGADAVVKDKDGKTAVQLARDAGWNDVVKVFQELKMG